jgi:hypothetical protein
MNTGRRIAPVTMVAGLILLGLAAILSGLSAGDARWWEASVRLAVLGGLTPMIYAVNHRIVPVFSRRAWPRQDLWVAQIALAFAGAVGSAAGARLDVRWLEITGAALVLLGGLAFLANLATLFRQPVTGVALPLPFEGQRRVDRIAIAFSRMAGIYLLVGLTIGLLTSSSTPDRGRWELVWAHALLLGFVVSMASSVTYHILPRWTTARWRTPQLIPAHFVLSAIALPLMLAALAGDWDDLFLIAGPLQAAALACWIVTILPPALKLPRPTREAMLVAFGFLAIGISLGASFAVDDYYGAIYRQVHAGFNLYGWAGMLILGAGYYLVPRFASSPLRWHRLASAQIPLMAAAVFAGGILRRLHVSGEGDYEVAIVAAHLAVGAILLSFALQVALTFRAKHAAAPIQLQRRVPAS